LEKISKAFGKRKFARLQYFILEIIWLQSSSRVNTKKIFNDFIFSFLLVFKLGFAKIIYERKNRG